MNGRHYNNFVLLDVGAAGNIVNNAGNILDEDADVGNVGFARNAKLMLRLWPQWPRGRI